MTETNQISFYQGVMSAQVWEELHPDALKETKRSIDAMDGRINIPGGAHATWRITGEGRWYEVDLSGCRSVSTVHFGDMDIDSTMELVAIGFKGGGYLNAEALAAGLKMVPVVVTVIDPLASPSLIEMNCIVAAWIGTVVASLREF